MIKINGDVKELLEVSRDEEELEKEYLEYYCIDNKLILGSRKGFKEY